MKWHCFRIVNSVVLLFCCTALELQYLFGRNVGLWTPAQLVLVECLVSSEFDWVQSHVPLVFVFTLHSQ